MKPITKSRNFGYPSVPIFVVPIFKIITPFNILKITIARTAIIII